MRTTFAAGNRTAIFCSLFLNIDALYVKKGRRFARFLNVGGLYVKEVRLFFKLP